MEAMIGIDFLKRRRAAGHRTSSSRPQPAARPRSSWFAVLKDAVSRWSEDQVSRLAASLAYFMLFSMAPLVLITVAVLGIFFGESAARSLVAAQLHGFLGADKARALHEMLLGVRGNAHGGLAGVIGFVVLLSGASSVVGELQASLNQIYGVHPVAKTFVDTLRRRLVSLGFVLAIGFLLLVSLGLGTVVAAAAKFFGEELHVPFQLIQGLNQSVSFVVITALFAGMFRFLPDARLAWRDLAVGAAVTALLFIAGNIGLTLYLGKLGAASAYGAAGSLIGFLLWTYYCAQIVYFGAEFTRAYAEGRGGGLAQRRSA